MAIDFAHYEGREPAFVKHTFIDKYLPILIGKVCSVYREFVYVDGFAGPWKSVAGEAFEDTSFGIALNHMTRLRDTYRRTGQDVRMRAFLVEKEGEPFEQLKQAVSRFPEIDITPLNGKMEDFAAQIAASIPSTAFSFTLIDPKGFPEFAALMPLLKRQKAEALINFMFDFANRFAGTNLIPALEDWLSLLGDQKRRENVDEIREQRLERLAAEALRVIGGYTYAPIITVDKVLHDRPLYKLIFLSRHPKGLEVFRHCEEKTLEAQATVRSMAKAKMKADKSGMEDLFSGGSDAVPNDRSAQIIDRGRETALAYLVQILSDADNAGMLWRDLWPRILENYSATLPWLGRQVTALRKAGKIDAPGWPSDRKIIPEGSQRLIWIN